MFVYLLPRFLSTDEENTSSLCLVVQVSAYMFTEQKLAGSQFFAHASLCDGKARGEADSLGTGLSIFSEQMSQVASTPVRDALVPKPGCWERNMSGPRMRKP